MNDSLKKRAIELGDMTLSGLIVLGDPGPLAQLPGGTGTIATVTALRTIMHQVADHVGVIKNELIHEATSLGALIGRTNITRDNFHEIDQKRTALLSDEEFVTSFTCLRPLIASEFRRNAKDFEIKIKDTDWANPDLAVMHKRQCPTIAEDPKGRQKWLVDFFTRTKLASETYLKTLKVVLGCENTPSKN